MSTLYIIGNGFDLHHLLKTKYSDFHSFVEEHYNDLGWAFEEFFALSFDENYLWSDFEHDLRTFNWKSFFNHYNSIDVMSDSFKLSERFGLEDEISEAGETLIQHIRDAFGEWIDELEYPELTVDNAKLLKLDTPCKVLNFNYTASLELYYGISQNDILYIHNKADGHGSDLIFGHGTNKESDPKTDEQDENGDSNRTIFTDAEDAARTIFYEFKKDTKSILRIHREFFTGLSNIDQIIVLGHSLGDVDWPYFRYLRKCLPSAEWQISYYGSFEENTKRNLAHKVLNLDYEKIKMIRLEDL